MKPKAPKSPRIPYPFVRVVWLDAFSEDPWHALDEYVIHDQKVETTGYLFKENERYWLICSNVAFNHEDKKWEGFATSAVPKSMAIRPLKILRKVPTPRKPRQPKVSPLLPMPAPKS